MSHFFAHSLNVKHLYLTHRSGVTTPGQRGRGSNGNEEVFRIPQSSNISEASPSDFLALYALVGDGSTLQRCSRRILQLQLTGPGCFSVISRTLVGGGLTPRQR